MYDLVLLRHGESAWNAENLFTGWVDVDLSERGRAEAVAAGRLMADEDGLELRILHTSLLVRAITTAELALHEVGRSWIPVRRHWRLNERHYGALQGLNKKETASRYGESQVYKWRRSYDVPPPPLSEEAAGREAIDPRYRGVPSEDLPRSECLADVVRRALPYWEERIVPDLRAEGAHGGAVIVVAHGNSLRALRKHIDGIPDDAIARLEIPTGIPYRYRLNEDLSPISAGFLGDPEAALAAGETVRRQSQL